MRVSKNGGPYLGGGVLQHKAYTALCSTWGISVGPLWFGNFHIGTISEGPWVHLKRVEFDLRQAFNWPL